MEQAKVIPDSYLDELIRLAYKAPHEALKSNSKISDGIIASMVAIDQLELLAAAKGAIDLTDVDYLAEVKSRQDAVNEVNELLNNAGKANQKFYVVCRKLFESQTKKGEMVV